MRALALALALALVAPAAAQEAPRPADAPLLFERLEDGSTVIAPEDWILLAKRVRGCEVERDELRAHPGVPVWVVVAVGILAAGAAAGATYGVMSVKK